VDGSFDLLSDRERFTTAGLGQGCVVDRLDLPVTAAAARTGREFVAAFCTRHHLASKTTEDAVLITSELLSNAYLHARSPAVLTVQLLGRALHIGVADQSDTVPVPRHPGPCAAGGRGLLLLDALAQRWGVLPRTPGKTIWFELPVES
jgi:anti-sigma regulatory factor (Ser/Thr protein kinase)